MAEQPRSGTENGRGRWGNAESWVVGLGAGLAVLALLGVAYAIGYNQGQDDAPATAGQPAAEERQPESQPEPETAASGPGKELFAQTCGSCHTLSDAGTAGTTGPSFDVLEPDVATVETAIRAGGAGTGAMPPNLLEGNQARQVAEYVAAVAGG